MEALVLVGAQAIYLQTGDADLAVAEYTTDADFTVAPADLADAPLLADLLGARGFTAREHPGGWLSPDGIYLDIMVPDLLAGAGSRGARLGPHGKRAARRAKGLEGALMDFAYNPKIPAAHIRDLATLRFLDAGESVVLHGPVGVGKSMIAQALGHAACRRGHSVAFAKTSRLLADLAGGHADRSWESRLRRWARPGLLICDDFAMRQFTPTQADDLYDYADPTIMPSWSERRAWAVGSGASVSA